MSKLKTNTIQHTGGSADNITLDNSQNVTVENNLTVDGTSTLTGNVTANGKILVGTTALGANADDLCLSTAGNTGISIKSGTSSMGNIYFADDTSGAGLYRGYVSYNHSGDALLLGTANTTALSIDSLGNVAADIGNLVIGTAGKGIDFSVNSSGNGTMTSELLDDYEEGTFTPTYGGTGSFGSNTYSTQVGYYTKVGRLVTLSFYVQWTNCTGGSGGGAIGGLPYTGLSGHQGAGAIMWTAINIANDRPHVVAHTSNNASILYLYASGDDVGWDTMPLDSAGSVLGTVSYPT